MLTMWHYQHLSATLLCTMQQLIDICLPQNGVRPLWPMVYSTDRHRLCSTYDVDSANNKANHTKYVQGRAVQGLTSRRFL